MRKSRLQETPAYITRDMSGIRELMHPAVHGNAKQSLAEATVPPGCATLRHRHHLTEELYHFTHGQGFMCLGDEEFPVTVGDTVCIEPGQWHSLRNAAAEDLRLLCCCSPPYSHDDTELTP